MDTHYYCCCGNYLGNEEQFTHQRCNSEDGTVTCDNCGRKYEKGIMRKRKQTWCGFRISKFYHETAYCSILEYAVSMVDRQGKPFNTQVFKSWNAVWLYIVEPYIKLYGDDGIDRPIHV